METKNIFCYEKSTIWYIAKKRKKKVIILIHMTNLVKGERVWMTMVQDGGYGI